ncbi:MAG: SusC/RagA family TonB-linked outer membrane protein, partial [Bacteroidota bacterium]
MSFDWRNGGQFISQTQRYIGTSQRWLDHLINPGGRTGKELRDWLVANEDIYIKNGFHNVGGPTAAYGGFRENYSGTYVSDGTFVPGVVAVPDGKGGVTYIEHLGENMPLPYMPYIGSMPWNFTKVSMFDADFVKLREISLSYKVPQSFLNRIGGIQNLTVAVYSRNIMLWTKAKMGIDPERAFEQGDGGDSRGMNFKQGIERYNLEPWVIPVGFKLDLTF